MGSNEVELTFKEINLSSVTYTNTTTMKLKGFMSFFGFLFKGMFAKQSVKYMVAFKKYVENK